MESVELCARLSRLVRVDGAAASSPSFGDHKQGALAGEVRVALDAVVAFYDDDVGSSHDGGSGAVSVAASHSLAGVDDMVLMALQRLLLTTLRVGCDSATQERAFVAVALLVRRCQDRLQSAQVVELLQASALYLPTPAAAMDPSTATTDTRSMKIPEERTMAVLDVMNLLMSAPAVRPAVQQLTRSQDSTHFLAYVVSCLLQLAERERHRGLAVQSIHVLQKLLDCVATDTRVLRMFFPGVSVGMWKTMSAPLQSSKVVVAALECLSATVSACLSDTTGGDDDAPSDYSLDRLRQLHAESEPTATSEGDETNATDAWLDQASEKVNVLLSHILSSKAMDRQPWRVCRALVDLCGTVVVDCRASLSASFFRCFEELMVMGTHAITDVSQAARVVLDRLQGSFSRDEWLRLEPQFVERFEMQLSTLAVQCGTEQESVSAHTMEVLIGYLQFQQQRFQSAIDEAAGSIIKTLAHVMAFDGFDVDLLRHDHVREVSLPGRGPRMVLPYFRKRFRYFHDETTVAVALRLLRNVGAIATPAVVVDAVVTSLHAAADEHDDRASREAVLVIFNECLRTRINDDPTRSASLDNVHLVGRVLDDLLALPVWRSADARDKNTMALLVECIGVCVELCGSAFDELLLYTLYPLVEKLGDPAIQVEQAALTTLQRIAAECGHAGDLHALFSANMDYFVDALCARLEELETYPQAPQVVEALLRHATVASLPLVDEITRSLLRAVDLNQDASEVTTALLRSLQLLLGSFATERTSEQAEHDAGATTLDVDIEAAPVLTRFLLEMRALTDPLSSALVDDENAAPITDLLTYETTVKSAMPVEYGDASEDRDDQDDGDREDQEDDDKEPPPLPFQSQTVEILERCSYFLSDADPMACCLVLATIEQGVRYLRARRLVLLPLVHRMWPSILHRLSVPNRPILTATMDLLATLAECAGDFIGDRFVETVWPSVKTLLASMAETETASAAPVSGHGTRLTRSMLMLAVNDHSDPVQSATDQTDKRKHAAILNDDDGVTVSVARDRGPRPRVPLETKLLNATLRCLRVVCEQAPIVTSIVPTMTDSCVRFLSPSFPDATVALTQQLLLALAQLNGDEVFVAVAGLAAWQPPVPPSARFPAYDAGVSAQRYVARDQATRPRQPLPSCQANASRVLETLLVRAW